MLHLSQWSRAAPRPHRGLRYSAAVRSRHRSCSVEVNVVLVLLWPRQKCVVKKMRVTTRVTPPPAKPPQRLGLQAETLLKGQNYPFAAIKRHYFNAVIFLRNFLARSPSMTCQQARPFPTRGKLSNSQTSFLSFVISNIWGFLSPAWQLPII